MALIAYAVLLPAALSLDNGVGQRPIMGFDAWYAFATSGNGCHVGSTPGFSYRAALEETAKVMVAEGYRDAGYRVLAPSDGSAIPNPQRGPGGAYRVDAGAWQGGVAGVQNFSDWLHDELSLQSVRLVQRPIDADMLQAHRELWLRGAGRGAVCQVAR